MGCFKIFNGDAKISEDRLNIESADPIRKREWFEYKALELKNKRDSELSINASRLQKEKEIYHSTCQEYYNAGGIQCSADLLPEAWADKLKPHWNEKNDQEKSIIKRYQDEMKALDYEKAKVFNQ